MDIINTSIKTKLENQISNLMSVHFKLVREIETHKYDYAAGRITKDIMRNRISYVNGSLTKVELAIEFHRAMLAGWEKMNEQNQEKEITQAVG